MLFHQALAHGRLSTSEALALFDRLPGVETAALIGSWQGASVPTGHPYDGLLERFHWHGKRFESEEHVHPLLFRNRRGGIVAIEPRILAPQELDRFPWLTGQPAAALFQLLLPLLATDRSRARLRSTLYRGKLSAAMLYDTLPIHDIFRGVDPDTVFGLMDFKGMEQPYFFLLRREDDRSGALSRSAAAAHR